MPLPGEDRMYATKKHMEQEIISLLGGRAAEYLVLKDVTTGASNDIERATAIARNMVTKYGMSDVLGPIQFGDSNDEIFLGKELAHNRNYGESIATIIDQEVKKIVEHAYAEAQRLLSENIKVLHKSAKYLVENEKMTGDEFRKLFKDEDEEIKSLPPESEAVKTEEATEGIELEKFPEDAAEAEKDMEEAIPAEENEADKKPEENGGSTDNIQ